MLAVSPALTLRVFVLCPSLLLYGLRPGNLARAAPGQELVYSFFLKGFPIEFEGVALYFEVFLVIS